AKHIDNKAAKERRGIVSKQSTLHTSISATQKKNTILDLVEAFVGANILLEK
ncbi:18154_t:CDS:1, partial [Gigaspora rosea]